MIAAGKWSSALLCGAVLLLSSRALAGGTLIIKGPNSPPYGEALDGFRNAHSGGLEIDRRDLPKQLRGNQPSLIVAFGREAAEAAHQQAPDVPLVFLMVANPATSGLTGPNIGGISTQIRGDVQLRQIKELLPTKKSIAVIHNPDSSGRTVPETEQAAGKLGVQVEDVPVNSAQELRDRFNFVKPRVEAIWVISDEEIAPLRSVWEFLREQANRSNLPLIFTNGERAVAEGALGTLMPEYRDVGRQGAEFAQQITTGKLKIADLGIRSAESARWIINTKTARKIGLAIPRQILESAKVYP